MTDLFKKTAIFSLSVITAIGMMGAIAAPSTANAQSLSSSQIDSIISLLQSFGADQGTIDNVEASLMGEAPSGNTGGDSGSTATKCDFNRDLYDGRTGSDVKCLQEYLNSAGYTVANSGVGSPGNETEYFGSLTAQAVTAWQNANKANVLTPVGLSSGTGYWGQSSIDYYNQVAAGTGTGDTGGDDSGDSAMTPDSGVDVSAESMDNVTIPRNATLVNLGEFNFASGENTDVDSLTFKRKGAGDRADWDRVYIYDGNMRVGSGRTVNSNHEASFSNLGIDLDDGEVKTLTLKGTVSSSNSGNVHYFDLTNAELDNNASVSGLPASGRQITTANATVGSLDVTNNDPAQLSPELGDEDVELFNGDFQSSNEDMDLESVTVTQYGSITMSELDNYSVEVDGSEESADISVDGDEVTIDFDGSGYYVEDGDNVTVSLRADITADAYIKGSNGTIQMNVDESSDVTAIGRDYGYGANITHAASFGSPGTASITVNASEMNFSFVGPQVGDLGLNGEDVVLFETKLTIQAETEIEDIKFDFANGTGNNLHLQDLKLVKKETGRVLAGPNEISAFSSGDSPKSQTFSDVFSLSSGSHNLQVKADIGNNTENNSEVTVTLDISNLTAENLDTSENIDVSNDVIPTNQLAGKKQTITQPDLTVDNSPTPASQTYVVGKSDTTLGAFVLEASKVSSIDVRQIKTDLTVASGSTAGLTGSLTLRKGSATGDSIDSQSISSGASTTNVTFDTSGDLNLSAGEQTTVYVVGSLKSDFNAGGTTASTTITSVTAKDDDNNDPLFNGSSGSFSSVNGTSFTIQNSGSFNTVAFGGNNPSEDMVITPGSDVLFSSYRLRPQNEDVQMRDFVASITSSTEAKYFDRVKAFVNGSQVSSKVITTSTRLFEDVNVDLTKDVDTTFDFKATLVDNFSNLDSGAELQLVFATTTTSNYDIVGIDSGSSVTFPTSSISTASDGARTYQVANSYPTFEFTGSDGTLTAGTKNLYKFDVTAENDDVELRDLTFEIETSEATTTNGNLQVGSFELLKNGSVVGTASGTPDGTVGDGSNNNGETASTTIKISNVSDYTVGSGSTATFTLRGNVSGVASDDANSVSVKIDNNDENASFAANDTYNTASSTGNTIWSDTYRHFNGTYLDFPTDSQTLSL